MQLYYVSRKKYTNSYGGESLVGAYQCIRLENTWEHIEHNRYTRRQCEISVNNFPIETTCSDMMKSLKAE